MVEATVVRAPAGLGKTSLVLEAVASGDVDTVEVYAPTHALCEEQADKLREANPDITCKVIGGRGHLGTDGQPLCRKDDLASEVAFMEARGTSNPLRRMTVRELQTLALVAEGKPYGVIAENLHVSYKTVANTCTQLKAKLGVRTLPELMRIAIQHLPSATAKVPRD